MKIIQKYILVSFALSNLLASFSTFAVRFRPLSPELAEFAASENIPFFKGALERGLMGSHTMITPDGYFLTAFHNITSCLQSSRNMYLHDENGKMILDEKGKAKSSGLVKKIDIPNTKNSNDYDRPYYAYKIDQEILKKGVYCTLGRNYEIAAKIISLGAEGWFPAWNMWDIKDNYPELFSQFRQNGYTGVGDIGDFALLKMVPNDKTARTDLIPHPEISIPSTCLPVSRKKLKLAESIINLAFPTYDRGNGNSSKYDIRISEGKVITKETHPRFIPANLRNIDDLSLLASIDSEPGSSGSSVLNDKNEIVGVIHLKLSNKSTYKYGTTVFVPMDLILNKFEMDLGKEFVESELLNRCPADPKIDHFLSEVRTLLNLK